MLTKVKQKVNMRYAFVPPKGMLWASCDFSAQEVRIAAAASRDKNLAKIYRLEYEYLTKQRSLPTHPETGEEYANPLVDIHIVASTNLDREVKRLVYEEPWNAHAKNPIIAPVRKKAKPLTYGLIYLAQAPTIAEQIESSVEEAQEAIDKYFSYPDGFWGLKEWLDSLAALGNQIRWTKLITGEIIFCNESNSKGMGDGNVLSRKICNHQIQGLAATQTKRALIKIHKALTKLNDKYRNIVRGREGFINAVVHDETNSLIPGDCHVDIVPDKELNDKYNCTDYVKYKYSFDPNIGEHALALEYGEEIKAAMQSGMQETFDIINSEIPAVSSVEIGKYWIH